MNPCVLIIASSGLPGASTTIGGLYVTYDIEFFTPVAPSVSSEVNIYTSTSCDADHPFQNLTQSSEISDLDSVVPLFIAAPDFATDVYKGTVFYDTGRYLLNFILYSATAGVASAFNCSMRSGYGTAKINSSRKTQTGTSSTSASFLVDVTIQSLVHDTSDSDLGYCAILDTYFTGGPQDGPATFSITKLSD